MFRLWGKIWKENRLIKDLIVEDDRKDCNRTKKIFDALDKLCYEFDLQTPIWLAPLVKEFGHHSKVRFSQDSFIESINFDYFEIMVIEEDDSW